MNALIEQYMDALKNNDDSLADIILNQILYINGD
mgnify:CR=1 FL=1